MYQRHAFQQLTEALADTRVVLVNGPRQVGKSTLVRQLADQRGVHYLTLDDSDALMLARLNPQGFIQGLEERLIILDEIQRIPECFLAIKVRVDIDNNPGQFLLTGSTNVMLLPQLADSLAGRMQVVTLWPLSQGEIENRQEMFLKMICTQKLPHDFKTTLTMTQLIDKILTGGFPEALKRSTHQRRQSWFRGYINTITQRDIRDLANIEGSSSVPRLLALLASRTANLLNFADLSRSLGIAQTTLKRYFNLLEITYMVYRLPAYHHNYAKRLVKSPKIMLMDLGVCSYLLNLNPSKCLQNPQTLGHLVENFIVNELMKQTSVADLEVNFFHFRTDSGIEVDLVVETPEGEIIGIEIKSTDKLNPKDFKGLEVLSELTGKQFKCGMVLYMGKQRLPYKKNISAMPIAAIWQL